MDLKRQQHSDQLAKLSPLPVIVRHLGYSADMCEACYRL